MKTFSAMAVIATLTLTLTGCDLWFGNHHCDVAADPIDPVPEVGLLDPFTGQCEYTGGGGGGGVCGSSGDILAEQAPEFMDMAACYSECTDLTEDACLQAPGCRAAYVGDCPPGFDCNNTTYSFFECWATAPSGPVQGGVCADLDAYECSRHDDCVAHHVPQANCPGADCAPEPLPGVIGNFEYCANEPEVAPGCYSDQDCPDGLSCNAAEVCDPPPGCTDPAQGCPTVCYGTCVPTPQPSSCYGEVFCDALTPECPAGTVPGIGDGCWTGECIPYAECVPAIDPGTCYGQLVCDSLPPECPADSVPGVLDGCWSGMCIPATECEMPVACIDAPSEAACIAMAATCSPVYVGVDCTCDPNGVCTCANHEFQGCADL